MQFEHLSATLRTRALSRPHEKVFTYLLDGEDDEVSLTYGELDRQARSIAARLQAEGMTGQRILLLYVPGLAFISALYGCMYAGAIPVPAFAPDPGRLARTLPRLQAIVQDCDAAMVLTTSSLLSMVDAVLAHAPDLAKKRWAASEPMAGGDGADWAPPAVSADDVALVQYTSGSTSVPKGVVVNHRPALANLGILARAFDMDEQTRIMMWVPFYHDMGLIGGILLTPFLGGSAVLMSPTDFIKRPFRWLRAIHKYRATMSLSPNFALDLCVRKCSPEELAGLDLSSWRTMICGSEPVRHDSVRRFLDAFEPFGLRPECVAPSYGLAEAVLWVSGTPMGERYRTGWFDKEALEQGLVLPRDANAKGAWPVVSCGRSVGQRIEIVDPQTQVRSAADQIGEIWVSGPNIAQGYWNRPEELATTFAARIAEAGSETFLRTGDLGFVHEGDLYVIGRLKDLVILRGRNIYPPDIEHTVEHCHPRVRPGCTAAFSVEGTDGEALVIVAEVVTKDLEGDGARKEKALGEVVAAIVEAVGQTHEAEVSAVALIGLQSIPKTSSGKIQRRGTRAAFLKGELPIEKRWDASERARAEDCLMPTTPTEEVLSDLWKEVLGIERVGVHDNFFALGGQSVLATQVVARLHSLYGVELPTQTLFEASTIADLAKIIEALTDPSRMEEIDL
jgi:acyl-CoA synthetase (AMP-forming)/AMP-acid ligase II/acyl carrier protein